MCLRKHSFQSIVIFKGFSIHFVGSVMRSIRIDRYKTFKQGISYDTEVSNELIPIVHLNCTSDVFN